MDDTLVPLGQNADGSPSVYNMEGTPEAAGPTSADKLFASEGEASPPAVGTSSVYDVSGTPDACGPNSADDLFATAPVPGDLPQKNPGLAEPGEDVTGVEEGGSGLPPEVP